MAGRRVGDHRDFRLGHLGKETQMLLDAVVRRRAQTARRHAVVVGNVRVEPAVQQLLHEI